MEALVRSLVALCVAAVVALAGYAVVTLVARETTSVLPTLPKECQKDVNPVA